MTSGLFATTVVVSFFVVAVPHILPCPAPRITYADGEISEGPGKRRRRRKPEITETPEGNIVEFGISSEDDVLRASAKMKRECPVPKPGGTVGELLGFKKTTENNCRRNAGE